MIKMKIITALTFAAWFSTTALAQYMQFHLLPNATASFVWVGKGADSNWTTVDNWSTKVVPGINDTAVFNFECQGFQCDVTVNTNVSIAGLRMDASYTGTITQGSNTIAVGAVGFQQAAGTFVGGSANITVTGPYSLTGGSFTSTTATLSTQTDVTIQTPAATFSHNNGLFLFSLTQYSTRNVSTSGAQFNNVNFFGISNDMNINISGNIDVLGNLLCHGQSPGGPRLNTGTVSVRGNITTSDSGCQGTGSIILNGNSNQSITGSGSNNFLPNVVINSSGGSVSLVGNIAILGNLTHTTGTVVAGTSNITFVLTAYATQTISAGPIEFYNVVIAGSGNGTKIVSGNLVVNNTFTCSAITQPANINTGTVVARGNLVFGDLGCMGSGLISVAGNTNQSITGIATAHIPNIDINSTGGIVSFVGSLLFSQNMTYSNGVVDAGISTAIFGFVSGTRTITVSNLLEFNNVNFSGVGSSGIKTIVGTLAVDGTFECSSTTAVGTINSGTISARGNLSFSNLGCVGTSVLLIEGASTRTISGVSGANIPVTEINHSGVLNLSGTLRFSRTFTYNAGTINPGTSTAYFPFIDYTTQNIIINSYVEFFNISFSTAHNSGARAITGTLIANGSFNCSSSGTTGVINGGTVIARGDVISNNNGCLGTTTMRLEGSNSISFQKTANSFLAPDIVADKPGATITFTGNANLNTGQNWTLVNGTINLSGFGFRNINTLTLNTGTALICNGGEFEATTLVNNGTINCPGYSTYPFHWTGAGGNTNWNNNANWSGGVAPGINDVPAFSNAYCGSTCNATMNVNPNNRGVRILSDYTGVITQPAGILMTIGAQGWRQAGGTFNGSNVNQSITGFFAITGGTFTATSATLTINQSAILVSPGATFNHGSGSISVTRNSGYGETIYEFGGDSVNNISFTGDGGHTLGTPLTVLGNLSLSLTTYNGRLEGSVDLYGNLSITVHEYFTNALIYFKGTNNQTVTTSGLPPASSTRVGRVIFDKPSGTVSFLGNTTLAGYQHIQSGGVSFANDSWTHIRNRDLPGGCWDMDTHTPGNIQFQNVRYYNCGPTTISGTMQVLGNLEIDKNFNSARMLGGRIQISKNYHLMIIESSSTTEFEMVGSTNATLTASGTAINPGPLIINKTGGATVTQTSNFRVNYGDSDLILQSGTLNMAGFNMTIGTAVGTNNILQLASGTVINRGGGTLTYEALSNSGGTINP